MTDLDLGQHARVLWLRIGEGELGARTSAEFPTLMKAVGFVMEDLGEAERATAVIAIEQKPGKIPLEEIARIYGTLAQG
jgi:hypothetical protein